MHGERTKYIHVIDLRTGAVQVQQRGRVRGRGVEPVCRATVGYEKVLLNDVLPMLRRRKHWASQ